MSYTTRCPACTTVFRIVPDQLKISDGWVRCGHCADVFDATLYLETWTAPPTQDRQKDQEPEAAPPAAAQGAAAHFAPYLPVQFWDADLDPDLGAAGEPRTSATDLPQAQPKRPAALDWQPMSQKIGPAAQAEEADFPVELRHFATGAARARANPEQTTPAAAPNQTAPDRTVHPDLTVVEPDFVQQARRRAFWHTPAMRALLSLLLLLLALLLALQWALFERNRIAAWQPGLTPLLVRLCAPLTCKVGPLQRLDAIVIDSSALVRRLGNFYSFDLVLKNTAPLALAMPALELSLTDTRDAVLARRVFLPEELPGAPALLPARGSVSLSLSLALAASDATPMAGYRALIFYP